MVLHGGSGPHPSADLHQDRLQRRVAAEEEHRKARNFEHLEPGRRPIGRNSKLCGKSAFY